MKSPARFSRTLLAVVAGALVTAGANAGFTEIGSSTSSAVSAVEFGHSDILSGLYGGTFTSSGLDFTNGSITAIRINDFDDGDGHSDSLNLAIGGDSGMNDQSWTDGISELGARTRYATAGTSFGYFLEGNDPTSSFSGELLTTSTNPFLSVGSSFGPTDMEGEWRWGMSGESTLSSMNGDNADGQDHLVTYLLTGEGLTALGYDADTTVWLLFWDDGTGDTADGDFNDFVVELSATAGVAVPIPAPLALGGIGFLVVLLGRRRLGSTLR